MNFSWQRLIQSSTGRALAVVVSLSAVMLSAIHPLMYGLMPATPDGLLHLYRLVALDHAIRHGDLWPRYVPGFLFGYGAPVFNYYAPLSLYVPEILHLLGWRFLDALLIAMILYGLIGIAGAYLLGKVWGGPITGISTAVAYAYAPYILYDWPRRGAVAEFAALAILPWLLWAFWRLAMVGQRRDLLLAVASFSALILTHNITALYIAVLLVVYAAFLWWRSYDPPRAFKRLGLAMLFSLGLTTFFWLPALAESRYVFIERVTFGVANLDFHNNFQTIAQTFALPLTADLTQLHPPIPRPLGWPQIALALAGFSVLFWPGSSSDDLEQKRLREWAILACSCLIVLVFMTTRAAVWIWEIVPLMHFIQFPWRLLGPASLLLAVLAGLGIAQTAHTIRSHLGQGLWTGICLAGMILYALPWLYGAYLPDPPARSIIDAQNFERETGWLAGTAAGEYVPIWTTELPDMNRLLGLYAEDEVIPRLQPTSATTVTEMSWRTTGALLSLEAHEATTLVFDWLYFPGWWARLNDQEIAINPTTPQGFVSVEVPAGQHTLELGFGPTPLRLGALIASAVFAAAIGVALTLPRRLWRSTHVYSMEETTSFWAAILAASVAGLLVFSLKALWIDHAQTPITRSRFAQGIEAGLEVPVQVRFNHEITLLGYDLQPKVVPSGQSTRLQLYWQLLGDEISENYSSVVYLRDPSGNIILQAGSQHPGDLPISQWIGGEFYVQEQLHITVPQGTPPGTYPIDAALYSHTSGRNLDVSDAGGNPVGVTVQIGVLEVRAPSAPANPNRLGLAARLDERLNDELMLLGISDLPDTLEVGQPLAVTWGWRASSQPTQLYRAQLVWEDEDGEVAATSPILTLIPGYGTDQWRRGDVWKGTNLLTVPGRLKSGTYEVGIQLLDTTEQPTGERLSIGNMSVTTPPRSFDPPNPDTDAEVTWQNGIRLLGYDLNDRRITQGEALEFTLYWQPESDLTASLTLFVHLVDQNGNIVAQQDQIPVRGSRPTTGWAPAEVVTDSLALYIAPDSAPGQYHLQIGWYNAATGERVRLITGVDYWLLPDTIRISRAP